MKKRKSGFKIEYPSRQFKKLNDKLSELTNKAILCYRPEKDNPYPLCLGAENPQDFALNDCETCNLYCDFEEGSYEKK